MVLVVYLRRLWGILSGMYVAVFFVPSRNQFFERGLKLPKLRNLEEKHNGWCTSVVEGVAQ